MAPGAFWDLEYKELLDAVRAWQWWEMIKAGEKPVLPSELAETRRWLNAELEKMRCEQANSDTSRRSTPETAPATESADSPDGGWWSEFGIAD